VWQLPLSLRFFGCNGKSSGKAKAENCKFDKLPAEKVSKIIDNAIQETKKLVNKLLGATKFAERSKNSTQYRSVSEYRTMLSLGLAICHSTNLQS